jgi:hypothetical protein
MKYNKQHEQLNMLLLLNYFYLIIRNDNLLQVYLRLEGR